jgi:hypothetical protein
VGGGVRPLVPALLGNRCAHRRRFPADARAHLRRAQSRGNGDDVRVPHTRDLPLSRGILRFLPPLRGGLYVELRRLLLLDHRIRIRHEDGVSRRGAYVGRRKGAMPSRISRSSRSSYRWWRSVPIDRSMPMMDCVRRIGNNLVLALLTSSQIAAGTAAFGFGICCLAGKLTMDLFDSPMYKSTSVSDFWGRRWNRLVGANISLISSLCCCCCHRLFLCHSECYAPPPPPSRDRCFI